MIKHFACQLSDGTLLIDNHAGEIELTQLEQGEVILTKQEVSQLAKVLSTEFISYEFLDAKSAVRKLMRAQKS